jgi:osmotically-inducible protein OsmY
MRVITPADSFSNPFDRNTFVATELRYVMNNVTSCITLIATASVFSLTGCDVRNDSSTARTTESATDRTTRTTAADNTDDHEADNTGSNADNVGHDSITSLDQSEASEHISLTADIRQAVIADDSLSISAKNCKIITDESGSVWLRGVVDSMAEKDRIERIARQLAGTNSVKNELEIDAG